MVTEGYISCGITYGLIPRTCLLTGSGRSKLNGGMTLALCVGCDVLLYELSKFDDDVEPNDDCQLNSETGNP